jgi:hypothetical protein
MPASFWESSASEMPNSSRDLTRALGDQAPLEGGRDRELQAIVHLLDGGPGVRHQIRVLHDRVAILGKL